MVLASQVLEARAAAVHPRLASMLTQSEASLPLPSPHSSSVGLGWPRSEEPDQFEYFRQQKRGLVWW